ncbi:hypothetical protein [Streptomyces sp. YIM 98790]|uniref:hypothetical protein n=1 Tax=Streptomyces sp. YIM 98790 TaxID=2689077 RepID=UPI001FB5EDCC|nr:hypothetical protein [Streptomyces sp. YIM 98790]
MENPAEEGAAAVQLPDVPLDLPLDRRPARRTATLEALLLSGVQILPAHPVVPVEHQLQPHELFQLVVAQAVLQRKPVGLVHVLAAGGQLHEQVVAQEIGLAQLEAGVVQRLEVPRSVMGVAERANASAWTLAPGEGRPPRPVAQGGVGQRCRAGSSCS